MKSYDSDKDIKKKLDDMKNLSVILNGTGSALIGISMVGIFMGSLMNISGESIPGSILGPILMLVFAAMSPVGVGFIAVGNRVKRKTMPLIAEETREKILQDSRSPFLILRPFTIKDAYIHRYRVINSSSAKNGFENRLLALAEALQLFGPPFSLGGFDGKDFDADRFTFDLVTWRIPIIFVHIKQDNWWKNFAEAANYCRAIILLPAVSPGVLQEVQYIQKDLDLLTKTIIFMPSAFPKLRHKSFNRSIAVNWAQVRYTLSLQGFRLPAYTPQGMLFIPNNDLSVKYSYELQGRSDKEMLRLGIEQLLTIIPNRGASASTLLQQLEL
jgi:hypothetical protein